MKFTPTKVLGGFAACILTLPLMADVTYTYTGNDFQVATGSYTTSDFVTGFFTVASPLPDNLVFSNDNVTPTSYSFTDGVQTFSSMAPPPNVTFDIGTDGSGNITMWDINLASGPPLGDAVSTDWNSSDVGEMDNFNSFGEVIGDPGTWAMSGSGPSPVPEPGNVSWMLVGLLAGGGFVQRRLSNRGSKRKVE